METKPKPVAEDVKRFVESDLVRTLLLGAMAVATTIVLYLGWDSSPLSGGVQPQQHAQSKAKEELDRRFHEGVTMLHAKQYEYALTAFLRVLQLNPKMPEAHVNAGYALLGMGDYKAAADSFDAATTLRPNQLNAYYGLGEALQAMGDKQGALQAMETYLHRSPAEDPFRRKAEAATWELRAALEKDKSASPPEDIPEPKGKAREGRQ